MIYNHYYMAFDVRLLSGLTVFGAVVETGSFVGAGASLGLTQSGVSRSIQRLEERLSTRLLVRSPRAVTLTSEGRHFYEEVKPLLVGRPGWQARPRRFRP